MLRKEHFAISVSNLSQHLDQLYCPIVKLGRSSPPFLDKIGFLRRIQAQELVRIEIKFKKSNLGNMFIQIVSI